ncbi:uncharacterized protein [Gossypium hirsutum]|uniref:Uncharacterized protein isoform X2 n=1 Tax=Gossypium hirsutum TaxID=3635 RepID=A0ABM2ZCH6_GOSHI|nr:uncharacterized protein LOC107887432 isoform X2 [Gossypium hirsutum]
MVTSSPKVWYSCATGLANSLYYAAKTKVSLLRTSAIHIKSKGSADELNRGYFDDISELKQNGGKIALANKILIPGIAARKFPAVDVIYSDGRKSKLLIVFDASGVDASKLAVPEASLVCLSFRANSQAMVDSWSKPFYDAFSESKSLQLNEMAGLWFGKVRRVVIAILLHESSCGGNIGILAFFRYFWLAWCSLVFTLKACWLNKMNKFTVLRDLNFVAENLGVEFFKDIWTFETVLRMYEIREWKMDHSKVNDGLLCNHVPKQHTCYSRILKSHPSSDCNFRQSGMKEIWIASMCLQNIGRWKSFWIYYSGEEVAPVSTIFIGGNHEASNYLWELYYGGWAAPNIYFLGYAVVVKFGNIRIGGLSGIYNARNYCLGHHERPPYNDNTISITDYGNWQQLVRYKKHFKDEIQQGTLGSKPAAQLLEKLKPSYWFSAHLH